MGTGREYPWRPEIEVLLACARREMRQPHVERAARAIAAGAEWPRVIDYAHAHGLIPLLHRHAFAGAVLVPVEVAEALATRARIMARRSLFLAATLVKVLDVLSRAGIDALPLKGPTLSQQVYGGVAARAFGDLDVLIRQSSLAVAVRILQQCGYHRALVSPQLQFREETRSHHVALTSADASVRLELHTALLAMSSGRRFGLDVLGEGVASVSLCGREVPALRPEELMAYLCQHGSSHAWSRLEWLATAAELARSGTVQDWSRVLRSARSLHGERRIGASLSLMNRLLGDVPFVPALPGASRRAVSGVVARLARDPRRSIASSLERFAFQVHTDDGLGSRLKRMLTAAFTPQRTDLDAIRLDGRLSLLYYLLRPLRLGWRYARHRRGA